MTENLQDIPEVKDPLDEPGIPIDFNTFVLSLSSSAAYHLGLVPHPETNITSINLCMARQTIDMLKMLMHKTQGNLTTEEERLIREVHYNLRTAFIAASAKAECSES
ncbi:MAG: DUF1844 domain-containing protein [Myxococcales bacterium]|jgi:hypothetical protein|nr:DUF1844 domain-containing protein [Myxococcales bacterium]